MNGVYADCGSAVINGAEMAPGSAQCMLGLYRCSRGTLAKTRVCEWFFCGTQAAVDAQHTVSPRATRRCSASIDSGHSMLVGWW